MTRIDADVGQGGERLDQLGQLILANQRVDGDEDPAARLQAVGVGGDFVQFVEREVLGLGPGGEFFQPEIDGVGTEVKRGEGGIRAAGGSQQFGRL